MECDIAIFDFRSLHMIECAESDMGNGGKIALYYDRVLHFSYRQSAPFAG